MPSSSELAQGRPPPARSSSGGKSAQRDAGAPLRLRLLCIDLDGTLVDTAGEIAEAVHRSFDDLGLARRSDAEVVGLIGKGTRELMQRLIARLLEEQPARAGGFQAGALMARFEHHYAETAGSSGRPYPGCQAMLERLRARGVALACVTNKELRHTRRVLAATGLAAHFELVIAGDSLPVKKPDAAVLRHALSHFDVAAAEAAHLGDSAIDVACARHAGVAAWAVPHGYNAGVPIAASQPDRLFADLGAVADFVCGSIAPTSA